MSINLKGRSVRSLFDLDRESILQVFRTSDEMKREWMTGVRRQSFAGRTMAMIFQKPSLRTVVSFQVGFSQLGGTTVYLGPDQIKIGQRETTEDIAKVLSEYVDLIMARTFGHDIVLDLARFASVPVINGLSDLDHPCQALADLFTVWEKKGRVDGLHLAYFGDGNNVANALIAGAAHFDLRLTIVCPDGHRPDPDYIGRATELRGGGDWLTVTSDRTAAVGADVLYTDVWASMGQEAEREARKRIFARYQLDMAAVEAAAPDCLVLHCLPAHYGEEITDEVVRDRRSAIFQQAGNRLHAQKGLMVHLL